MSIPEYDSEANERKKMKMVMGCWSTGPFAPTPDDVFEFVNSWPEGPEKFVTILLDKVHQFSVLDRYERLIESSNGKFAP